MHKPNFLKFFAFLSLGVAVYICLLYFLLIFESGATPVEAEKVSIRTWSEAVWYSTVTLTTVGYGDMTPVTAGGRIVGAIFILFSMGIYGLLIGKFANILNTVRENRRLGMNGTSLTKHVVIIGWTDFGKAVTDQLVAAGKSVSIVTKDKNNIDIIHEYYSPKQVSVLFSDYNNYELLQKVNITESSVVFVNLNDDTDKLVYILNLKKNFDDLVFIVTLENANLKNTFLTAGVTYAISKHEISSKLLASYIFEPDVAILSEELLSVANTDDDQDIKQFAVTKDNPYNGVLYDKVFFDLKRDTNALLLGIVKDEPSGRKLYKNPDASLLVKEGNYLIMICNNKSEEKITRIFHTHEGI